MNEGLLKPFSADPLLTQWPCLRQINIHNIKNSSVNPECTTGSRWSPPPVRRGGPVTDTLGLRVRVPVLTACSTSQVFGPQLSNQTERLSHHDGVSQKAFAPVCLSAQLRRSSGLICILKVAGSIPRLLLLLAGCGGVPERDAPPP